MNCLLEGSKEPIHELSVRTLSRLNTVDDFNNLIIRESNGIVVRLKDIGFAELYPENDKTILRRDGVPMVGVVTCSAAGR